MAISLYKDYFQKSRIFMYPLLGIKRGVSVTPIETYISWEGYYEPHDCKLMCVYHLRKDSEFILFEKERLLNNKLFCDFKLLENDKAVYVFDFSCYKQDWLKIINGKYSKISNVYKKHIENFYGKKDNNYAYIESFLYPQKYYSIYAELFSVKEALLVEVEELCSKINLEKETLKVGIKNLEVKLKNT